ncbi:MAG TPA: UDP-N-acetylmuramoyl-tripeptide--D-alanyl-D-alanine ligase [Candidatus Saccharimonadia bacterium]|nr:UDP-N-acetylmuramoyl-tripeptide--D-alanyl-D-alanine ligase [Candidatus Saccharimonadia bacterium]
MLQLSEYNVGDYLDWYHRTRNFAHVERRKHLVKTSKALLVWSLAWVIQIALYGMVLAYGLVLAAPLRYVVVIAGLALAPFVTPYLLVLPLLLVKFLVQGQVESVITRRASRRLAAHKAVKIAVAGSFGKTSMREILRTVLSEGKRVAAPPHSYNTPLGISRFIGALKGDEEILVFELGEYYPGDVRKLCQLVQPELGVITGVNEAHLHKFKNLKRTADTIFELADWLGDRPLYVNGESDVARNSVRLTNIMYTREGAGEWLVKDAKTGLEGTSFTLARGRDEIHVKSHLLGLHQVGPLAAAADIASRLGLTPEQIQRGLEATAPFDHRLQPRTDADGVTTLDDSYNGNPSGAKAVIEFLQSVKAHRRFYVTPGLVEMGSRTAQVHIEIGRELAAAGIEEVVLMRNSATPYIARGLEDAGFKGHITWFDDGPAAYAALPQLAVKGDVVLLQNDWPDQYG